MNVLSIRKKRIFVDMDGVLVDFQSGFDALDEELKQKFKKRPYNAPGIFGLMKPMPGAIKAIHELSQYYDIYILSTAPWDNPSAWMDKVMWVKKYLDDVCHKKLIISHHKELCKGGYLIDDRERNGASEFEGEWIQFGTENFSDWKVVVEYLIDKHNMSSHQDIDNKK